MGGFGDLEGLLECRDIVEGEREDGKDDNDVLRCAATLPLELRVFVTLTVSMAPVIVLLMAVGRCIAFVGALGLTYMGAKG